MASIRLKTAIPGPKSLALMERRKAAVARGPFHVTPVFVNRASGALIEDVDGNQFIDFAAGIGVANVGHADPKVVKAIQTQAEKFIHTSFNVVAYESYIQLCEELNKRVPITGPKKSFLVNSGSEAVENAVKIARAYTGKPAVICFDHAYHGRTYMAMTLTAKEKPYRFGFGPFNADVYRSPFPYCYRWESGSNEDQVSDECFAKFENLLKTQVKVDQVAAVILEPLQGEGGFIPAPVRFLKKLREFCTANKVVLIADEIQSGFGRTGTLFASEQLGLNPDLMTIAKGLGAGLPISAVTGRAEIMDAPMEGGIGGTYSGNPVACEAALAVMKLFDEGKILNNVKAIAETMHGRFDQWKKQFDCIGDVRGLGAMIGIELVKDRAQKTPNPELTKALVKYSYEHGVITMSAGTYSNVIRFLMPLTIDLAQLNEGLDVIEQGLKTIKV